MRLDRYTLVLALALSASPAIAQQSMPAAGDGSLPRTPLIRSCSDLGSSTDCGIGLPDRSLRSNNANRNALDRLTGGGMVRPRATMGAGDGMLSRGISGGMIGHLGSAGALGRDSDHFLHPGMSGGMLDGRSLGGRSLGGGSLGGGSLGGGRMH